MDKFGGIDLHSNNSVMVNWLRVSIGIRVALLKENAGLQG
jgi:hypothetical protein